MRIHTFPLGVDNCYLLEGDKGVLIDGGAPPPPPSYPSALSPAGNHRNNEQTSSGDTSACFFPIENRKRFFDGTDGPVEFLSVGLCFTLAIFEIFRPFAEDPFVGPCVVNGCDRSHRRMSGHQH